MVFSKDRSRLQTKFKTSTFLTILRNLGGLLAILYAVGSFFSSRMSQLRQETSVVKRTYQVKILKDKDLNSLLGMEGNGLKKIDDEGHQMLKEDDEGLSIVNSLYKLLISRQRLPRKHAKLSRLMAKGRRRAQEDLDVVNQARNTQRIKAMS